MPTQSKGTVRYDPSNPDDLAEIVANGVVWKSGPASQMLAIEALIAGTLPMNDRIPPAIAAHITARQAEAGEPDLL